MNWRDEIELEFARAKEGERTGNHGKARTSARRAAGVAITELERRFPEKKYGKDFITQLRTFASDTSIPEQVRSAADRLQARLSSNFESPSTRPIEDAVIIADYVLTRLS
jgi:hypothetical protein